MDDVPIDFRIHVESAVNLYVGLANKVLILIGWTNLQYIDKQRNSFKECKKLFINCVA